MIATHINIPPTIQEMAQLILGDDYITPREVEHAYSRIYPSDEIRHLAETHPNIETICWLRANRFVLMPRPVTSLNLCQVRELGSPLFSTVTKAFDHEFFHTEKISSGGWMTVRREEVPKSLHRNWLEQQKLIGEHEEIPSAVEVSYAITTFHKVRGILLLQRKNVRTSSVCNPGDHVFVGSFDEKLPLVDYFWDECRFEATGLASSWKLGSRLRLSDPAHS